MLNHFFYSDYNIFCLEALLEMLAANKVLTACRRTKFFYLYRRFHCQNHQYYLIIYLDLKLYV